MSILDYSCFSLHCRLTFFCFLFPLLTFSVTFPTKTNLLLSKSCRIISSYLSPASWLKTICWHFSSKVPCFSRYNRYWWTSIMVRDMLERENKMENIVVMIFDFFLLISSASWSDKIYEARRVLQIRNYILSFVHSCIDPHETKGIAIT